ncbi:DNA circularization protein [Methylophaga nitratireducenticrescens]|uniref:DNA circularization protein n=1 Tax=Methylophaga nitratireducenticrescens TaxID=754476 RepID=UPI000CDCB3B6|nr:DNA circularization N-terminal domain-containing protein [Methylophaga nitratireducenticrescens]AUZ85786.1 hypothetical protein CDW43_14980 [Methylophaga nitratireducenticrescens]AUZ85843.1 hypothetical protein CDW43_15280 [Methylophaga nitratireducenticrescens]
MSWRATYTGKGKYGTAEFLVREADMEFGRRNVIHEYPQRDEPYVEDLGLKARRFTLEAFVIGRDYHIARDNLMKELEKPGPSTLEHPYLGAMQVSLASPARLRESNRHGGMAQFTLNLIVAGKNKYPDRAIDTQARTAAQADVALQTAVIEFESKFNAKGLQANHAEQLQAEVDTVFSSIDEVVGTTLDPISLRLSSATEIASILQSSISRIGTRVTQPLEAIKSYSSLFNSGINRPVIPLATRSRQQQATSTKAVYDLVNRTTLIEAARSSSQAEYATYDDAIRVRNNLLTELDVQMKANDVSDDVFTSLLDLRVTVIEDIRTRGADLSRLTTYTPKASLPALVIAHNLYGDAFREQEVIERNNVSHPGFVSGGQALEVLNV